MTVPAGALGTVVGALGTVVGALGGVPVVLPVPARSCCKQLSRSAPIMFSQRLRPPIADGDVTGAGVELTEGVCDGETAGAGDWVVSGGCPGEVLGAVEGALPGACANAAVASARRAAVLSVLNMRTPFNELWLLFLQAAYRAA